MAQRLPGGPEWNYRTTDHSDEIAELRAMAAEADDRESFVMISLAADLLQSHDETGISLDDWPYARQFVEQLLGEPILPTGSDVDSVCPSCGCAAVNLVVEYTTTVQLGDEYMVEAQVLEARCKECGLEVPVEFDRITITGDGEAPM